VTILSPWIRRALFAGGFGGGPSSTVPHEIASVVPYSDGYEGPVHKLPNTDIEVGDVKQSSSASVISDSVPTSSYGATSGDRVSVVQVDTPFFHFDLQGAVRAAESGLSRQQTGSDLNDIKHPPMS